MTNGTLRLQISAKDGKVISGLREFNNRQTKKSVFIVKEYSKKFIKESRRTSPVVTGRLKDSIGNPAKGGILKFSPKGLSVQVGTRVPYAVIVEMGVSKEWVISSSKKRGPKGRLKFMDKSGNVYYAKQVTHPTIKGKYFMKRASDVAREAIKIKYRSM